MIRLPAVLVAMVCFGSVSSASAQVFYEPVQYQYRYGSHTFYYGGHDPRVFDYAASEIGTQDYSSVATIEHGRRGDRVYTDGFQYGNVADNSYTGYSSFTASDARNEAYNNVPRYFRKRDLLRAALVTEDGTLVVPAQAHPIIDIRVVRPFSVESAPVVPKGTILVIPKKWLEKPAKKAESSVVMAER
jgi:hypothetical protein